MVDTPQDPNIIAQGLDAAAASAKNLASQAKLAFDNFNDFTGIIDVLSTLNVKIQQYAETTGLVEDGMGDLTKTTADFLSMITSFKGFDKFQQDGLAATGGMNSQFKELLGRFGSFDTLVKKISSSMPTLAVQLAQMGMGGAQRFLELSEQGAKLESGMIGLAASTGKLNDVFGGQGTNLKNVSNLTEQYAANLSDTVIATHMSANQVTDYVVALGKIPGIMDQTINITKGGFTQSMTGLVAVTKLAALAHIGAGDAATIMGTAYENLSNPMGKVTDETQKGINLFALMVDASTKLNLRFDDTKKFLTEVSQEFKFMGDNTEAATKIMGTFVGALRDTGLSAKASMDIVQGMVKSVGELSTGTKTFLSIRSGGVGGLQGSFQVDRLIREGKTDEVIQMMTRSLRQQMGGRIVGLEEADRSPSSAAQFYRQRALLQSGAFGSLVGKGPQGDAQANRLLDAMSKGQLTGAAGMLGGKGEEASAAVSQSVDRGSEIQERQVGILSDINNGIDALVMMDSVRFNQQARQMLGTGNAGIAELARRQGQQAEERLVGASKQDNMNLPNYEDTFANRNRAPTALLAQGIAGVGPAAGRVGEALIGRGREAMGSLNAMKDMTAQTGYDRQVEAGQTRTAQAVSRGRTIPAVQNIGPILPQRATPAPNNEAAFHKTLSDITKASGGLRSPMQMTDGLPRTTGQTKESMREQPPMTLKIEVTTDGSGVKVSDGNGAIATARGINNASTNGVMELPRNADRR